MRASQLRGLIRREESSGTILMPKKGKTGRVIIPKQAGVRSSLMFNTSSVKQSSSGHLEGGPPRFGSGGVVWIIT